MHIIVISFVWIELYVYVLYTFDFSYIWYAICFMTYLYRMDQQQALFEHLQQRLSVLRVIRKVNMRRWWLTYASCFYLYILSLNFIETPFVYFIMLPKGGEIFRICLYLWDSHAYNCHIICLDWLICLCFLYI